MLQLKVCMLGVNFGVFLLWVGMKSRADVIYRCHVMRSAMLGLFLRFELKIVFKALGCVIS